MTKTYCLTIEVGSDTIANGLGYMVAFSLPSDNIAPADHPQFSEWASQVRDAVLRAGDQVFSSDPYTKKVAIAELMNELADLNNDYDLQVKGSAAVPDVQIQSTNPYDPRIDISFTSGDGDFTVTERGLADLARRKISGHGQTGLVEGSKSHFPFSQQQPALPPRKRLHGPRP